MVTLFEWRSDILLGLGTKHALISAQEFVNVLPWGHAHGPVFFPDEVTTKMEAYWTCTLELKLILGLQKITNSLGSLAAAATSST